jgi:hypothetical protein
MNIHAKFGSTIGEVVLEKILKTDKTLFDEKGLLFLSLKPLAKKTSQLAGMFIGWSFKK